MTMILCIVAVIAAISIYDYLTTRSWQQVTSNVRNETVFENRNRAYGAYQIRRNYNRVLLLILCGVAAGAGVLYATTRGKEANRRIPKPDYVTVVIPLDTPEDKPEEIFDTKPEPPASVEQTTEFVEPEPVDVPVTDPISIPDPGGNSGLVTTPGGGDPFIPGGTPPVLPPVNPVIPEPPTPPTMWVDEPAEFPGGHKAMLEFLRDNLKYPQVPRELGIEGKVFLKFVVSKTGNISEVNVERGVADCPECDREAVRVVKKMPDWRPGKVKGKPVDSYFNLPIKFTLQ